MWAIIILLVVAFVIMFIYMKNSAKHGYHFGAQMFKSSEDNLDAKPEDLSDRNYYGDDKLLK